MFAREAVNAKSPANASNPNKRSWKHGVPGLAATIDLQNSSTASCAASTAFLT